MGSLASDTLKAFDQLLPMHVVIDGSGRIAHMGPTLHKLMERDCVGQCFSRWFQVMKPLHVDTDASLNSLINKPLTLKLLLPEPVILKAHAARIADQSVIALSFGFSVAEAVRRFNLSETDFAPTDQTIGILYLSEAYSLTLGEFRNLSMRQEGAKRLAEIEAHTDALTGLFNRRGLNAALHEIQKIGQDLAIMQIDLDHFKAVNDGMGHAAGDAVLVKVAEILVAETRKNDLVARNGGDEFTIVLTDVSDRKLAEAIGNRIVARVSQPMTLAQGECQISASIGTVFSKVHSSTNMEALLQEADAGLYKSKSAGRGRQTLCA